MYLNLAILGLHITIVYIFYCLYKIFKKIDHINIALNKLLEIDIILSKLIEKNIEIPKKNYDDLNYKRILLRKSDEVS